MINFLSFYSHFIFRFAHIRSISNIYQMNIYSKNTIMNKKEKEYIPIKVILSLHLIIKFVWFDVHTDDT